MVATRGGGYGEGTPREGWDHAQPWLPHGLGPTGLKPRFITTDLTLAEVNPAMSGLIPLAAESLAAAEREIDALWAADPVSAWPAARRRFGRFSRRFIRVAPQDPSALASLSSSAGRTCPVRRCESSDRGRGTR